MVSVRHLLPIGKSPGFFLSENTLEFLILVPSGVVAQARRALRDHVVPDVLSGLHGQNKQKWLQIFQEFKK